MNYEPVYPIIHIYSTVQGQGPRIGEPMTLVRTSSPLNMYLVYHKTTRETPHELLTAPQIAEECLNLGNKWVFFGGDDPCLTEFNHLAATLRGNGFKIWLDTCGTFPCDPDLVDHLSTGPKPLLPLYWPLVAKAHDVRFYWEPQKAGMWEDNIDRCWEHIPERATIHISPRVLTQEAIDGVIKIVLKYSTPRVRADIPLFRIIPNFDKNMNQGRECPICHLMDVREGGTLTCNLKER